MKPYLFLSDLETRMPPLEQYGVAIGRDLPAEKLSRGPIPYTGQYGERSQRTIIVHWLAGFASEASQRNQAHKLAGGR
jgi:hypothetical protein